MGFLAQQNGGSRFEVETRGNTTPKWALGCASFTRTGLQKRGLLVLRCPKVAGLEDAGGGVNGLETRSKATRQEFFDFACPTGSLGAFLEICNDETLLHPFCDLRFTRFLQEYYEGGKVMPLGPEVVEGNTEVAFSEVCGRKRETYRLRH